MVMDPKWQNTHCIYLIKHAWNKLTLPCDYGNLMVLSHLAMTQVYYSLELHLCRCFYSNYTSKMYLYQFMHSQGINWHCIAFSKIKKKKKKMALTPSVNLVARWIWLTVVDYIYLSLGLWRQRHLTFSCGHHECFRKCIGKTQTIKHKSRFQKPRFDVGLSSWKHSLIFPATAWMCAWMQRNGDETSLDWLF